MEKGVKGNYKQRQNEAYQKWQDGRRKGVRAKEWKNNEQANW